MRLLLLLRFLHLVRRGLLCDFLKGPFVVRLLLLFCILLLVRRCLLCDFLRALLLCGFCCFFGFCFWFVGAFCVTFLGPFCCAASVALCNCVLQPVENRRGARVTQGVQQGRGYTWEIQWAEQGRGDKRETQSANKPVATHG